MSALMAVSEEVTNATKRKAIINEMKLKDTLKRVSTQTKTVLQTAIFTSRQSTRPAVVRHYTMLQDAGPCCIIPW